MTRSLFRTVLLAAALVVAAPAAQADGLTMQEVLDSVRNHHPLLAAARTSLERAEGQVLAADGAFDPRVRTRGTQTVTGYYDNTQVDAEVRMLTPLRGIVPFVGWRLGLGALPTYDGKLKTLDLGEMRAGIEVPLLQGGSIDRARGDRQKARIGRGVASAEVRQRELDLMRDAALAYWNWVAAGHRLGVRESQLDLARTRADQIANAIKQGSRPPIDGVDNARLVAAREALVVSARLDLQRTSLELSLYLRDKNGEPVVPAAAPRPDLGPIPAVLPIEHDLDAAVKQALTIAPRLAELARRLDITATDIEVARNQTLPTLNVSAFAARGLGPADPALPDRDQVAFGVGATFELPIFFRQARGAEAVATADKHRLEAERRFAIERITTDVRALHADLDAARTRADLATQSADLAEQLAAAERIRFERGDSTLVVVNIREEAAADAAATAIDARAEVLRARARFFTLLGEPPH